MSSPTGAPLWSATTTSLAGAVYCACRWSPSISSTGDGRGFTQARLLRQRHGYQGELRAVGKIRADQMYFLAQCGFDAFELLDDEDVATAVAQLDRFSVAYQTGAGVLTHPRQRFGG
jgi:uncharacterized protein (DUF934 family)